MRSVQLVAPQTLEECEMPMPPDPGPGKVLVRIRAVGICGSDMHWYLEGGMAGHRAVLPQVLGHEPAGVTHHYRLAQTPSAFATLAAYADNIGKAIVEIP